MRPQDIVPSALFFISALVMYLLDGKYPFIYIACAIAIAVSLYFSITIIAQAAGLGLLLLYTATSNPTLPNILIAIGILSVFIYGGNAAGGTGWQIVGRGFEITVRKGPTLAYTLEIVRVVIPAALLTIVTAVLASGVGVRVDNLLVFIFLISLGLLLLGLISRHASSQ